MGDALWYNGDFDGENGLANQENVVGSGQYAHAYDDFFVTDDSGWDVTSVYSNNLSSTDITGATWEIRQGVSSGNGGTIVASGMTATPTVTPTGRDGFGFTEFMVEVTGLNVHLDGTGDNHYWLNVAPIGGATGLAYDSTTNGANAIGTPPGNNGLAFFDSDFFVPSDDPALGNGHDFSMGVHGTVTGMGGGLSLVSEASRYTHGSSGKFDITLPGIEPRSGGGQPATIVYTFSEDVSSVDSASSSCGSVIGTGVEGSTVIVKLDNTACDAQTVTVTLSGVTATNGDTLASADATVSFLIGDVDGDGSVTTADAKSVFRHRKTITTSDNFRNDVMPNGTITQLDRRAVRQHIGDSL